MAKNLPLDNMPEPLTAEINIPLWQFIVGLGSIFGLWSAALMWLNSRLPRDYEARHQELERRQRALELWAVTQGYKPPD